MSQERNDNDLELDGFDYGDGSDTSGFVDDDDFGFETPESKEVTPQVFYQEEEQEVQAPRMKVRQQPQPRGTQQEQRAPKRQAPTPNQQPPEYQPRRTRPQQQGQQVPRQEVQTGTGVDRTRMKGQQRVNPARPVPQAQQTQVAPRRQRKATTSQIPDESVPMIESKPPKKKSKLPLILIILGVIIAGVVGFVVYNNSKLVPATEDYSTSGRLAYDNLLTAINSYDATSVDAVVGTTTGDSYLAQEWSYANNIEVRQAFIKSILANVSFTYPQVPQLSTTGVEMKNKDGSVITIESLMNNNEAVSVTHIDYEALAVTMVEDKEIILELYKDSGISSKDYDYEEEMTDLMLDYILSKSNLKTATTELVLPVSVGATPIVTDDTELDKLLFSSDEFHNMCDTFAQVATGFTGYETEKYTVKEEQDNPEYVQWKMRFDAYFEADNGRFVKGVSKWEPWYLRDENNNYILDENGDKIVNYYTVKDDQGNDWVQPSDKIMVDVEKTREVEVEWVKDSVIPYCFIGAYYCQNEYSGSFSPDVRVGDGTIEYPAGVGTPIITKALGTDGEYHDVKVTVIGYWTGQDAIDYAISFSEKNRGFDINSVIQLICYEIQVENLEDKDFTFASDMFLADRNANKSTRTGTMYGFYSQATVKAGESVVINDWATSTELAQKYVCWGSSFNRAYSTVYFKILAGEGDVPTYSAYKAFTGESEVTGDETTETSATTTTPTTGQ